MSSFRTLRPPRGELELVEGLDLSGARDDDAVIVGRRLRRPVLARLRMDRCVLRDVVVEEGDLGVFAVPAGVLDRVRFEGCRLTSGAFPDAQLQDVLFRGCRLDGAVLRGAQGRRVRFEDCSLREADLREADLSACSFVHCDLTGLDVRDARLGSCALRDCTYQDLRGVESLAGTQITGGDLMDLASALADWVGIEVLDDVDVGA